MRPDLSSIRPDLFISHASEDKDALVRPLAEALRDEGLEVWYDEFTLYPSDGLRESIDKGLATSKYGLVVLSPHFFAKGWTNWELDGLVQRQVGGERVIIPIWHQVSRDDVQAFSLPLANIKAIHSSLGVPRVVEEVVRTVNRPVPAPAGAEPISRTDAPISTDAEERLERANGLFQEGNLGGATMVWQDLSHSDDLDVATIASFNLGIVLERQGRTVPARQAYEQAMYSGGERSVAARAAFNLGDLLAGSGESPAAESAYRRAIELGDKEVAAAAALNLGTILVEREDLTGAAGLFRQAASHPDPEAAGMAQVNLGLALCDLRRLAEAEEILTEATRSASAGQAQKAQVNLGRLLVARGDREGARRIWLRASQGPDPAAAALARQNLETLDRE